MTEEEIKALQVAKETAERKATELEAKAIAAKAEADKVKGDLTNIVEELKTERQKKNEALEQAKLSTGGLDVNSIIENALKEREEQSRKVSFAEALNEFKGSKPEFQADAAGIVFSKFEDGLSRFNFSDVKTKEQMKARLEEAYRFINFKPTNEQGHEYEGSSFSPSNIPSGDKALDMKVKKVLETSGISEDRFKTLRSKYSGTLSGIGIE